MSDKPINTEELFGKIKATLTFDPTKKPSANKTAMEKAIQKIAEQRQEAADKLAEEQTIKLVELCEKRDAQKKQWEKQDQAVVKEINKLFNQIQSIQSGGQPLAEDTEEKAEE